MSFIRAVEEMRKIENSIITPLLRLVYCNDLLSAKTVIAAVGCGPLEEPLCHRSEPYLPGLW